MGDTPYDDFYCRLYQGHKGRYGHEFWEAQLMPNGHLRQPRGEAEAEADAETDAEA